MSKTDFFKVSATERQDQIVRLSDNNYLLIFGYGRENGDDEQGYNWRKYYDHKPDELELKEDITALIDHFTDERILTGFQWNGGNVYLSQENQMNFKAAYDLAVQTQGASLADKVQARRGCRLQSDISHIFRIIGIYRFLYESGCIHRHRLK